MTSNERRMRGLTIVLVMAVWIVGFTVLNTADKMASRAEAAYAAATRAHEASETRSDWWPFD